MYIPELEKSTDEVNLQDCIDMYFFAGKAAVINDGKLKGFEDEPSEREIVLRRSGNDFQGNNTLPYVH